MNDLPANDSFIDIKPDEIRDAGDESLLPGDELREQIMGLGAKSTRKSHYPELRKRLRELEKFRAIMECSRDSIVILSLPNGTILDCNREFRSLSGLSESMLSAEHGGEPSFFSCIHENYREEVCRILNSAEVHDGQIETDLVTLTGEIIPIEISVTFIRGESGAEALLVCRDITERRRSMERLRILSMAVEQNISSVMVTDSDARIEYVNPAFSRTMGYTLDEVVGQSPAILKSGAHDAKFYSDLWASLKNQGIWRGEICNRRKDGTLVWERGIIFPLRDSGGKTLKYISLRDDVTELRQLEEQLRQSQKMEAIGQLAGGIAHDFNNMLTAIGGYCELMMDSSIPGQEKEIQGVMGAVQRATALTRQLLSFSRKRGESVPAALDLNGAIEEIEGMLRRLMNENVSFVLELGRSLPNIMGDRNQLAQVIMNLVVNARDALVLAPRGQIVISTSSCDMEGQPGVCLGVSDNGHGIPDEIRERIFEPFFTTKEKDRGTGLGLSVVYGIVRDHGGRIVLDSQPGKGTSFRVMFPALGQQKGAKTSVRSDVSGFRGEGQLVLVVEDDPGVRDFLARALKKRGFETLVAGSGEEALGRVRDLSRGESGASGISLLITDFVLPDIIGPTLINEIRRTIPGLPVILCSGYDDKLELMKELEQGDNTGKTLFLEKPFTMRPLMDTLEGILRN